MRLEDSLQRAAVTATLAANPLEIENMEFIHIPFPAFAVAQNFYHAIT